MQGHHDCVPHNAGARVGREGLLQLPLNSVVIKSGYVQTSHGMEDVHRIILLDSDIEGHRKTLLAIPQYTRSHGTEKASGGNLEEQVLVDRALIYSSLYLVLAVSLSSIVIGSQRTILSNCPEYLDSTSVLIHAITGLTTNYHRATAGNKEATSSIARYNASSDQHARILPMSLIMRQT